MKTFFFQKNYTRYEKNVKKQKCLFQEDLQISTEIFFTGVTFFLLFIKNASIKIKNSIFPSKYTRYGKNDRKQNCSSPEDIQICFRSFFDRRRSFALIAKNVIKK